MYHCRLSRPGFDPTKRVLSCILLLLIFIAAPPRAGAQTLNSYERDLGRQMLKLIKEDLKKNYYDPTLRGMNVEAHFGAADDLIKNARTIAEVLGVIAKALTDIDDSHTFFIPPALTHRVDYGWHMRAVGDKCFVVAVRPGSDAEAKGMKVGDRVIEVDGFMPTRDELWKFRYFYRVQPRVGMRITLQSPEGKARVIEARAKVEQDPRVNSRSRYDYDINTIRGLESEAHLYQHRYYQSKDLVIWKMPDFSFDEATAKEILDKIRKSKTLILDLRGNPGGYVKTLEAFLGNFFDRDIKIADLKGRKEMEPIVARTRGKDAFGGQLIVLVDSASGSAAEIFARVVQLEKRGKIVGDRTAGAVTQSKFYRREGGTSGSIVYGAFITNADLIMTDGKSLEKLGVTPDETLLVSAADLAAGRDPVLSRAAALAGFELSPEKAGTMFPIEWPR
jgi:carboxyl-terminal processing protease